MPGTQKSKSFRSTMRSLEPDVRKNITAERNRDLARAFAVIRTTAQKIDMYTVPDISSEAGQKELNYLFVLLVRAAGILLEWTSEDSEGQEKHPTIGGYFISQK